MVGFCRDYPKTHRGKVLLTDKCPYLAEKNAGKNTYLTKFIEKYEN